MALVLLLDELGRVWHVFHLSLKISLLSVDISGVLDLSSSLGDSLLGLILLGDLDLHLARNHVLLSDGVLKFLLETVENLDSLTRIEFESQQLLVSLVDVLDMLLVLNL